MNEWKTGAKLADDKPERWPHGWTHRSDAPTVIERWEKGRVEEGERVGKRGKKARKENGKRIGRRGTGESGGRGKTEGQKKLRDEKTGGGARESLAIPR